MAFSNAEWMLMKQLKATHPSLSIRKLKDKIATELGLKVSVKSIHNKLFLNESTQKSTQKSTQNAKSTQQNHIVENQASSPQLVIGTGADGRNKYDRVELLKSIEELHVKGRSRTQIAKELNIPEDTVNSYLHKHKTKNDAGLTRSQQLKEERETAIHEKTTKLIETIVDDRIDDYSRNREFEKGLIETRKAQLQMLMTKIKNMIRNDKINEAQLKELNYLVTQLTKMTPTFTRDTVSILKDLGYAVNNVEKATQTNIEADKMIIMTESLKSILEDDD